MLNCLLRSVLAIVLSCLTCRAAIAESSKTSRYLEPVLGCLDTLIEDCTDTYGPEHSPMFCALVDLQTHRIPKSPPPLLHNQRRVDRTPSGGNLQHDLFTLLAMYHASQLTGEDRFAKAADTYLEFFLQGPASVGNGLFRAATGMDYYEAANGVGPLLIELIRLHLVLTGNDYPLPRYYADS